MRYIALFLGSNTELHFKFWALLHEYFAEFVKTELTISINVIFEDQIPCLLQRYLLQLITATFTLIFLIYVFMVVVFFLLWVFLVFVLLQVVQFEDQ